MSYCETSATVNKTLESTLLVHLFVKDGEMHVKNLLKPIFYLSISVSL